MKLLLRADDACSYLVVYSNGVVVGTAGREVDGLLHFTPSRVQEVYSAKVLHAVARLLDLANSAWEDTAPKFSRKRAMNEKPMKMPKKGQKKRPKPADMPPKKC